MRLNSIKFLQEQQQQKCMSTAHYCILLLLIYRVNILWMPLEIFLLTHKDVERFYKGNIDFLQIFSIFSLPKTNIIIYEKTNYLDFIHMINSLASSESNSTYLWLQWYGIHCMCTTVSLGKNYSICFLRSHPISNDVLHTTKSL